MYKVKDEIKIPSKDLSSVIKCNGNQLELIDKDRIFKYKGNKWFLTNNIVDELFMGYGFTPDFYLEERLNNTEFDDIFEEINQAD